MLMTELQWEGKAGQEEEMKKSVASILLLPEQNLSCIQQTQNPDCIKITILVEATSGLTVQRLHTDAPPWTVGLGFSWVLDQSRQSQEQLYFLQVPTIFSVCVDVEEENKRSLALMRRCKEGIKNQKLQNTKKVPVWFLVIYQKWDRAIIVQGWH